MNYIPTFS